MGGPRKEWTAADEVTLRAMMAADAKRSAIAEALGRTYGSVTARAIKLGIKTPSRHSPAWTEADYAKLEAMLAAGESIPAIARVLKRNQTDVAAKAFASWQGARLHV